VHNAASTSFDRSRWEDLVALLSGRDRADWRSRWSELAPSYRELAEVQLGV